MIKGIGFFKLIKLDRIYVLHRIRSSLFHLLLGESIPIRLFLNGYELTPTMRDVNKKFSVRYYLNLVLVDEEERRYFKQQEITIYRRREDDAALLGSLLDLVP